MKLKTILFSILMLMGMGASAQTLVTNRYVDNPDFESRFAGWHNDGFYYVVNTAFNKKKGNVYMERWVNAGSRIPNVDIYQELTNLPVGTYTLVAGCQNVQQSNGSGDCTGAVLYAGDESVEVTSPDDYSVTFTVLQGKAKIGFQVKSTTANWASIDNIRLYSNGVNVDSVHVELQKLITEAENAIVEGSNEGLEELKAAIEAGKAMMVSDDVSNVRKVAHNLTVQTYTYSDLNATGDAPELTLNSYIAMGSTIALARLSKMSNVKEVGLCWSTSPEPTLADNHSTEYFTNNGKIFLMEHLTPGTIYYVRGYGISRKKKIAYSNTVKIATLPKGNVTGTYNNGGSTDENRRINSGLNEIKWLYNNLTSITDFNLSVNYGAQTPTADCSYGGWMRVGPNEAYQQTGTMLHETNHGVGVGTSDVWWSGTYREDGDRGRWLGRRATDMIRFLQNDNGAFMTGDNTHMWPISSSECPHFGINGSWEDAYNPENTLLYYGNALITHAMHQDGLKCTSALDFASSAYVFEQDDNKRYYIKCEDETEGLGGRLLAVDANGNIVNKRIAACDAINDDNCAWYVTYDAATAKYMLKNVGTGMYLTNSNGTITTNASAGADSKMTFIITRNDINAADGWYTTYWVTNAKRALQSKSGAVSAASFAAGNDATIQRWLFLDEEQVVRVDDFYANQHLSVLNDIIAKVKKTMATPHVARTQDVDVAEVDAAFKSYISDIESRKTELSVTDIDALVKEIPVKTMEWVAQLNPKVASTPMNITWMIENPGFDTDNLGWSQKPTWDYNFVEYYELTFRFYQTLPTLPAATYEGRVQAFQRPGTVENVYADYMAGNDNVKVYFYLGGSDKTYIKNIWAEPCTEPKDGNCAEIGGLYVPHSMHSAHSWFEEGYYDNSAFYTSTEPEAMKMGLTASKKDSYYWTCIDNFRLYYYGSYSQEEIAAGIESVAVSPADDAIYDLQGRRLAERPVRGIYIKNNKKYVIQ